jgi:hypothetical protein
VRINNSSARGDALFAPGDALRTNQDLRAAYVT